MDQVCLPRICGWYQIILLILVFRGGSAVGDPHASVERLSTFIMSTSAMYDPQLTSTPVVTYRQGACQPPLVASGSPDRRKLQSTLKKAARLKQEAFEKCWAHSPLRAAARPNFTLPFTRCRYCHTPPAHRCPRRRRRQQRQRVTEGTAMAPWNGPNNSENAWQSLACCPSGIAVSPAGEQ